MAKVVILGLDGATFDLIHPWVQAAKLPHFTRLLSQGMAGRLRSTIPPMSPPAWNSFMTGMNPGKHGIYDFTGRKPHSYETHFINASWRRAPTMWQHLSQAGKRVAILSVPFTYPPDKVNGYMVSGMDAPGVAGLVDRSATYPPELCDDITANVGDYPMGPNLFGYTDPAEMVDAAVHTIEKKAAAARYVYHKEDWDLFMFVLGETDAASHRFWRYGDPASPLRDDTSWDAKVTNALLTIYQKADEVIGQFMALARPDTTVIVMSDHGNGGNSDKAVYLNRWLESQGLLRFRALHGVLKAGIERTKQLGLRLLPPNVKRAIYRLTNIPDMVESWARFSAIDWRQTQAYSEETPYYPSIWINLQGREPMGIVAPHDYEEACDHIVAQLTAWRNPYSGEKMIKRVHRREELYAGPHVDKAPDLTIEWELDHGYSYLFRPSTGLRRPPVHQLNAEERRRVKSGDHRDEGILLATGPHFIRPGEIKEASILDLAPTILYLLGLPIPPAMDGHVLTELFLDDYLSQHPIQHGLNGGSGVEFDDAQRDYSAAEEEAIRARLQGLGYIE
ncbi:MAG TPA: alkaline phosphatase family protein [Alphaproteobacteria bacterium]|nr:alkaline phosphatase family protein [Alphaproteobacteria bacterium]